MARSTPAASPVASPATATPTVVLVHGAFADASSWAAVTARLQAAGITVVAPANPLRGVAADALYLASLLAQTPGPILLVGHSYGGAVIGNAAVHAANVVGLVYVAAFAPDTGEVLGQLTPTSKDSVLNTALLERKYPTGSGATAVEYLVQPAKFHDAFCADLPAAQAAVLGASQRPIAAAAFTDPSTGAAWHTLPSWAVVATGDKAAGADVVRAEAERAKARITEVAGSHLIMVSQPQAVTDVIRAALAKVA